LRGNAMRVRRRRFLRMRPPTSVRGAEKEEFQRRSDKTMHAEHADGDQAAASKWLGVGNVSVDRIWTTVVDPH
jgi:hypothetical protein